MVLMTKAGIRSTEFVYLEVEETPKSKPVILGYPTVVNRKEQTPSEDCLLLREIFENRPDELHSIGFSFCFVIPFLGAKINCHG